MKKPKRPLIDQMKLHNAGVFVGRIMKRIKADPRVAWYFDPMTQSFDDLCGIMALATGISIDDARADFERGMTFERPKGKHEAELIRAAEYLLQSDGWKMYVGTPPFRDLQTAVDRAKEEA